MREGDNGDEGARDRAEARMRKTVGGFIIAGGCVAMAFIYPESARMMMLLGMMAAGIVDPSLVYNKLLGILGKKND